MTEDEAIAHLTRMIAASETPVVTPDEVADLVALFTVSDDDGNVIRYELARAAAEGWRTKAGRAAGCVDVMADGVKLSKHQLYAACMDLAKRYAHMDVGSTLVLTVGTNPDTVDPLDAIVVP